MSASAHSMIALKEWDQLSIKEASHQSLALDGAGLSVAKVVSVSRYFERIQIADGAFWRLAESVAALDERLKEGRIIYGVNTGFGGSADSRTHEVQRLQHTLIRELHYGILSPPTAVGERKTGIVQSGPVPLPPAGLASLEMPKSWVRAALLIRINSLVSGYSGVRPAVVERLCDLINFKITPRIPLRGSISASGDLSPLSYLSGAIQGKTTITVWTDSSQGISSPVTAAEALTTHGLTPVTLGPKEGLAIVNGTAISAAAATLAMHEAHQLVVLSQISTAMSVEALRGTDESFDPLFAELRPHPGQTEASKNILQFLAGSSLVCRDQERDDVLRQDRYSIRTASQWIGPALEDLALAHQQITIELNSVTDNPLIDTTRSKSLHGGNFQASAITSAMEKTRQSAQAIGRMLFTQCTELINPATSQGLPPNLVADEPSSSFVMKAVDLMVAALQSELGFLANPASSHVQTAEMGNQALNSLALVSARYTHEAIDVLSQLSAAHLLALCQALDLRALTCHFLQNLQPMFLEETRSILDTCGVIEISSVERHLSSIWGFFLVRLDQTTKMNSEPRFKAIVKSLEPLMIEAALSAPPNRDAISLIVSWSDRLAMLCLETFNTSRENFFMHHDATPYLGSASSRMYAFVRHTLKVPFLRLHNLQTPGSDGLGSEAADATNRGGETTGSYITRIYEAIRNGDLYVASMACLREVYPHSEV
ncbi:MAG: hypothetical protein Q9179_003738 [Wetmoreana sp. 5 TL-2023]